MQPKDLLGSIKSTHAEQQSMHAAEHVLSRAHGQQSTQQSIHARSMHESLVGGRPDFVGSDKKLASEVGFS
jgi:hypothetical protein